MLMSRLEVKLSQSHDASVWQGLTGPRQACLNLVAKVLGSIVHSKIP